MSNDNLLSVDDNYFKHEGLEMADAAFDVADNPSNARKDALQRHPAGRMGQPTDIASMAVWLASNESEFVTGQCYVVDGGLTAASPLNPSLF